MLHALAASPLLGKVWQHAATRLTGSLMPQAAAAAAASVLAAQSGRHPYSSKAGLQPVQHAAMATYWRTIARTIAQRPGAVLLGSAAVSAGVWAAQVRAAGGLPLQSWPRPGLHARAACEDMLPAALQSIDNGSALARTLQAEWRRQQQRPLQAASGAAEPSPVPHASSSPAAAPTASSEATVCQTDDPR